MKLEDLSAGSIVKADGGFTCIEPGEHVVHADEHGKLFILCADGRHFLDGQVGGDGTLIGITAPETHALLTHLTLLECRIVQQVLAEKAVRTPKHWGDPCGSVSGKLALVMPSVIEDLTNSDRDEESAA